MGEYKAPSQLVVSHHVLTKCDTPHSWGLKTSAATYRICFYVVRSQR
nr:MAG TPA: hypothetical protein [Caudoviricetes sp.]